MSGFTLSTDAMAAGYRLEGHDSVTSTNTMLVEAARAGGAGDLWIAARQQTEGRGRRGRAWQSPSGNLAASLLLRPSEPLTDRALFGFVAGVALSEALAPLVGTAQARIGLDGADLVSGEGRIALKWPNDVLADGAKLAGILLEAHADDHGGALIIGFGVNVVAAPEGTPYPATSLAALGIDVSAEAVFHRLSESWVRVRDLWDQGRGRSALLERWRGCAAGMGSAVAVSQDRGIVRGTLETVDDEGRLIVRDSTGVAIAISAGDVHFGMTASHNG